MSTQNTLFNSLAGFMEEIEGEKQASTKQAATIPSDPGGYQGPTTHPVKDVDNSGAPEQTGARFSENAADNKEDQPTVGVDAQSETSTGDGEQDSKQMNIGTNQSSTGEDPATEDRYKGTKDDPGTSHPSKSDDGQKYASASFEKASEHVENLSNSILADFANGFNFDGKVAAEGGGMPASPMNAKDPGDGGYSSGAMDYGSGEGGKDKTSMPGVSKDKKIDEAPSTNDMAHSKGAAANMAAAQQLQNGNGHAKSAAEAGYQLAAMLGMEKMSSDERAQATIEATIRDADHEADLVGQYVHSYDATLKQAAQKRAMGEMGGEEEGEDYSEEEENGEGGGEEAIGGGGEEMMGGGGGGGEEIPPELLAALAGAGGGGEEMGGMPGGEMGGMGGGGEDAALQELLMALAEAGISPEQLMGGGKTAAAQQECQKLASAAKAYQATGKFRMAEAKTAQQRQLRDYMKNHVLEVARS